MAYRNGNYSAFYVDEPFKCAGLMACLKPDFHHDQMLKAWKRQDPNFPFNDSHQKNYSVRDDSNWELTLKPRLRERLRNSKNIILFLSSHTKSSRALTEEIEYGVGELGLPVIVVYPDFCPILSDGNLDRRAIGLWDKLPTFKRLMDRVPTIHIPMKKESVAAALNAPDFMVGSKCIAGRYRL